MRSNRSETDRRRTTRGGKAGEIISPEDSVPRTRSKQSPPRSPARTRRVSPAGKSPARKSPARKSPAAKSPARKSPARKSPARKSPSRKSQPKPTTGKSPPRAEKGSTETEIRKPLTLKSKNEDKSETLIIPSDTKSITQIKPTLKSTRSSRRIEYTMRDLTVNINTMEVSQNNGVESTTSDGTDGIRKRKPREISSIKAMRFSSSIEKETEPVVSSKSSYGDSDEEQSEEVSPTEKCVSRRLATPLKDMNVSDIMASFGTRWEFGGRIGSLILIPLVPLLFFSLVAWSECRTCTIKSVPDLKSYISISIWFNKSSALLYSSLIILQIFLCILPIFGRRILSLESGGKSFFFNCPFAVVVTIAVAVALHCFGICKARDVLADYFKLSVASYLVGVLFSIAVFIKSRELHEDKLNLYANTGFISYDFMIGRELHPTIFNKLNVKILLHTISCSTSMTLLVYLLLQASRIDDLTKFHDVKGIPDTLLAIKINPTFLFFALLQISYISLWTWTDYQRISMFSWQSEGVGYLNIVCTLIYPFFFVLIPKFILDNNIVLDPKLLGGLGVIFTIAWFVCRYSNHVKYEIRRNPSNPDLLHLNLMPTFHGKRLIVNGLWGWIRHPNYTADIIMHLILAVPGVMASSISAAPALFTIFHLIYRASRDSERCRRRYGAAWQRYCARVPSIVVPKVY